jgi:hypothetical protein
VGFWDFSKEVFILLPFKKICITPDWQESLMPVKQNRKEPEVISQGNKPRAVILDRRIPGAVGS